MAFSPAISNGRGAIEVVVPSPPCTVQGEDSTEVETRFHYSESMLCDVYVDKHGISPGHLTMTRCDQRGCVEPAVYRLGGWVLRCR